ncbi:hypothetical protein AB0M46_25195 [Dactylosporangium sp. NPDC051485]
MPYSLRDFPFGHGPHRCPGEPVDASGVRWTTGLRTDGPRHLPGRIPA